MQSKLKIFDSKKKTIKINNRIFQYMHRKLVTPEGQIIL